VLFLFEHELNTKKVLISKNLIGYDIRTII
jgi:hypothetical protein